MDKGHRITLQSYLYGIAIKASAIAILSLFLCTQAQGQSVNDLSRISPGFPVYSQYLQNGLMINPATLGQEVC